MKRSTKKPTQQETGELKKEVTPETETVEDEKTKEWHYVPYGVVTFAEFDMHMQAREIREHVMELSDIFKQLVENALYDPDVVDKEAALTSLVKEFSSRCKQVTPEKVKETTPTADTLPTTEEPPTEKERSSFFTFKEASGCLRWFAVYSNNYLDDDGRPEIISEKSHQAYTYLVKEKLVPYPELWQWHIPGTRWGVADYVDYADGMAFATGLVDADRTKEAEVLEGMDILVSHGMPETLIVRNPADPSIIDFHITREISPLPRGKAANKFTGFVTL